MWYFWISGFGRRRRRYRQAPDQKLKSNEIFQVQDATDENIQPSMDQKFQEGFFGSVFFSSSSDFKKTRFSISCNDRSQPENPRKWKWAHKENSWAIIVNGNEDFHGLKLCARSFMFGDLGPKKKRDTKNYKARTNLTVRAAYMFWSPLTFQLLRSELAVQVWKTNTLPQLSRSSNLRSTWIDLVYRIKFSFLARTRKVSEITKTGRDW